MKLLNIYKIRYSHYTGFPYCSNATALTSDHVWYYMNRGIPGEHEIRPKRYVNDFANIDIRNRYLHNRRYKYVIQ